jgi:phosphatidylserine decarboxylase
VVSLGRERQQTPYISKTLDPEWKICLDMPLTDVPLVEFVCWDKDRFKKDYMGEFDIAIEELFNNGKIQTDPMWFKLKSRRREGKRQDIVSGEVQVRFSLIDSANPSASPEEILKKFRTVLKMAEEDDDLSRVSTNNDDDDDNESLADDLDDTTEQELGPTTSGVTEKKRRKKRLARLRRKSMSVRDYDFHGTAKDVAGVIFLEIVKATDLPPERNMTRTSFDCDPFVVTALGRKVMRTRVIRHNLNPIFNEKMVFQVNTNETGYSLTFSVMDKDNMSGNDFIASASFAVPTLVATAPSQDPDTGLYDLPEPPEYSPAVQKKEGRSRFRIPLSRSASTQSLTKAARPSPKRDDSSLSIKNGMFGEPSPPEPSMLAATSAAAPVSSGPTSSPYNGGNGNGASSRDDITTEESGLEMYDIPLVLKNKDRWEAKHTPMMQIKAKFVPYTALRQQFWRAMLKQYDADDSHRISRIELSTMLDTIGSTLKESTIDGFFERFAKENEASGLDDLTFDQAVICLEDALEKTASRKETMAEKAMRLVHKPSNASTTTGSSSSEEILNITHPSAVPALEPSGEIGQTSVMDRTTSHDLGDEAEEEHVIDVRECPICHQPKLHKRTDAEIVLHIATCASADWRQVNNLVMGGFVTQSQAQRKWYSKVITKISYGGYKLGANSANILVQDRITGQINEERMSVYVRLGIRVLYKALGSREMERKRIKKMLKSLSVKQGKKYDDPASASQIEGFIAFHQLNMDEVLLPTSEFRNFNEFFYRALKPNARPCSAPDRPEIIVSPADCRSVVFNTIDDATSIWVKGKDYSISRLFGDAYPLDAKRYNGGSMGIFRLAPQDYHRFHIPVDGVLGTPKTIEGEYYTVNPMAIRSALDVYGENVRVVVPIDSVAHGRVMYVCIGAMMVGSTVITRKPGEKVKRAEELGYFKFGGSTILVFFEPGKMVYDDDLIANSKGALETLVSTTNKLAMDIVTDFDLQVRVGMSIGHSPHVDSHKPDMKKENSEVTDREREEAKRRIEGSMAPDRNVPKIAM